MLYRTLGKTGIKASAIAFGGIMVKNLQPNEGETIVKRAIDNGVNYFDIAPSYENAQYVLGPAIKPYRKDVFIACKTKKRTAKEAEAELNESLKAMNTDYFDAYQLHAIDDSQELEQVFAQGGAMEALIKAKEKGKIRHIGFTCHRERSALYLMSQFDFDTVMHPFNFLSMIRTGKGELVLKMAQQRNMGILSIKTLALRPLNDGEEKVNDLWYYPIVNDDELSALAMRYTYNRGNLIMVTPGHSSYLDQMIKIENENQGLPDLTEAELQIVLDKTMYTEQIFRD